MFDSLSSKLQNAFRNLRGLGKISEEMLVMRCVSAPGIARGGREFKVARDFIERVKAKSLGQEVVQNSARTADHQNHP